MIKDKHDAFLFFVKKRQNLLPAAYSAQVRLWSWTAGLSSPEAAAEGAGTRLWARTCRKMSGGDKRFAVSASFLVVKKKTDKMRPLTPSGKISTEPVRSLILRDCLERACFATF